MTQQGYATAFSLRKSIVVWIAGAVLGWVVAVVSVYSALRAPDTNIAETQPGLEQPGLEQPAPERSLAIEQPADHLTPEELEALTETAPAAGGDTPSQQEDENGNK